MKKIRRLLAVILICVFCVGVCPLASAAEPLPGSTDLYLLSENNSDGQAKLLGKTVTVEGIVTVASGVWHDQVNYFSIVTPRDSYRFGGGTLVYSPGNATQYKVGDRVVVTGTVVNGAYASDKGTTAIRTASSSDIQVRGSGVALPDAYPIYTDPLYEEVELDPGLRFEGMPVRVLGKVSDVAAEGTVPFPVSWTVKMKKKQKETQDILSYHSQAAGCSDKARAKASGGRQPIEECGRTGL